MKKPYTFINIIFIFLAAFLFFSCSKTNQSPKTTIVGKWNITGDTSQTVGYPPYIIVGINSPYMQFNADGTGVEKDNIGPPDVILNFTYTLSNNVLTCNFPMQPGTNTAFITTGTILKSTSHYLLVQYEINNPTLTNKELIYFSR